MLRTLVSTLVFVSMASVAQAAPQKYVIDKDHSKVGFTVRHLMISEVAGNFKDFDASFTLDPATSTVTDGNFAVKTASIDTDNEKRDDHLRGADFFESAKFEKMTFANTKLKKNGKDKYKWSGDLTIRDVTKPVTFDLTQTGTIKDPWGNQRAGFQAIGKINRKDFGLKWNKALEGGGVTVGDEVTIKLDAEMIQQKDEAAAPAASPAKK